MSVSAIGHYNDIRPTQQIAEVDIINLYSLVQNSGNRGQAVVLTGDGWVNGSNHAQGQNLSSDIPNTVSPRWETTAKVGLAKSGERPIGVLYTNVRDEVNFGRQSIFDLTRLWELNAVASGETVPILQKGLVLMNFGTGTGADGNDFQNPAPGSGLKVSDTGLGDIEVEYGISSTSVGRCMGVKDADGNALVNLNFTNL